MTTAVLCTNPKEDKTMIQYPYIPPITGKEAEQIAEQADYNYLYRQGVDAPSKEDSAIALNMFQQAGLFL